MRALTYYIQYATGAAKNGATMVFFENLKDAKEYYYKEAGREYIELYEVTPEGFDELIAANF